MSSWTKLTLGPPPLYSPPVLGTTKPIDVTRSHRDTCRGRRIRNIARQHRPNHPNHPNKNLLAALDDFLASQLSATARTVGHQRRDIPASKWRPGSPWPRGRLRHVQPRSSCRLTSRATLGTVAFRPGARSETLSHRVRGAREPAVHPGTSFGRPRAATALNFSFGCRHLPSIAPVEADSAGGRRKRDRSAREVAENVAPRAARQQFLRLHEMYGGWSGGSGQVGAGGRAARRFGGGGECVWRSGTPRRRRRIPERPAPAADRRSRRPDGRRPLAGSAPTPEPAHGPRTPPASRPPGDEPAVPERADTAPKAGHPGG